MAGAPSTPHPLVGVSASIGDAHVGLTKVTVPAHRQAVGAFGELGARVRVERFDVLRELIDEEFLARVELGGVLVVPVVAVRPVPHA
ncbi:MAG: hypothetical protein EBT46_06820, partial [Actinobacteria bacterium]|nr:hypothetical protein [Actinomycetota bacterium]